MNKTATALVVTAVLALSACSNSDYTVRGLRDDVKVLPSVAEKSHQETKTKNKRECASKNLKGKCTSYRTVSSTKSVKVVDRPAKPTTYCVELDNVNGHTSRDDRWYEVSLSTYTKVANKDEGDKVKSMSYYSTGCSQ